MLVDVALLKTVFNLKSFHLFEFEKKFVIHKLDMSGRSASDVQVKIEPLLFFSKKYEKSKSIMHTKKNKIKYTFLNLKFNFKSIFFVYF